VRCFCEVCRDPLGPVDLLRGLLLRQPVACSFSTVTGDKKQVQTRRVCRHCLRRYARRRSSSA